MPDFRKSFAVIYHRKKVISKIRCRVRTVENLTLNPYIFNNFVYNMKYTLDSKKGHYELSKYI